ncbi:MAG: LysM peptidoglycan-binding domain-containing protein [Planctomycetota bacterium]
MSFRQRWTVAAALLGAIWVVIYWATPPHPNELPFDAAVYGDPEPIDDNRVDAAPDTTGPTAPIDPMVQPTAATDVEDAPPSPPVIAPEWDEHVVRQGETLESIARDYFGDHRLWRAISRMNGDAVDPNRLRRGQVIKIPHDPGNTQGIAAPAPEVTEPSEDTTDEPPPAVEDVPVVYVVRQGDTLSGIASRIYGRAALWTLIQEANRASVNRDGTNLRPGMELIIPPAPAR